MARRVVVEAPLQVAYEEYEVGPPGPGQIRVRAVLSGISHGTEMVHFTGRGPFVDENFNEQRFFAPREQSDPPRYPFRTPGYDFIGEVVEVGPGVENFRVGDRLFAKESHRTECLLDASNHQVLKLSRGTAAQDAAMLSLTAVALVAIHDAQIKLGDVVVVIGGGVVGQLAVQLAFLQGASRVFLLEPSVDRRRMAEASCAVETIDSTAEVPARAILNRNGGTAPDVVLECSGKIQGLGTALQVAGLAGSVVAVGFYAEASDKLFLGKEFLHNRITLKASMGVWECPSRVPERWNRRRNLVASLALIESGRLRLDKFATLPIPFEECQRAYETIQSDPSHMRVVLTYGAGKQQEAQR
jgi:2-desacetyl-2-hydroxyethyl bacteriochlorophyllide A dehydrogenase